MIQDINLLNNSFVKEYDIAIIGAGAAGITIAEELNNKKIRVGLIESGDFEFDTETYALNSGQSIGNNYNVQSTRQRFFGGTTNHWGGWCSPMDSYDFEKKSWVALSGWPITYNDLLPYYKRAQPYLDLTDFIYDDRLWERAGEDVIHLNKQNVFSYFWQISEPTRMGRKYRKGLSDSENVEILINANVTQIFPNQNGDHVTQLEVKSLSNITGHVKAKYYILASGGIENPRILLNSDRQIKNGIANSSDFVGRCFMEHLHVGIGKLITNDSEKLVNRYNKKRNLTPGQRAGIAVSEEVINKHQVQNGVVIISGGGSEFSEGIKGLQKLHKWSQPTGKKPDNLGDTVWDILSDLNSVIPALVRRSQGKTMVPYSEALLSAVTEQEPSRESRITLSNAKDDLGQRRLILDWKLNDLDKKTLQILARTMGIEFGSLGWGRMKIDQWLIDDGDVWPDDGVRGGAHHMGTTRMTSDPASGVVNENCRCHDVDNLFIAGSSVFTTSGHANPTLTIVALALKLSDYIQSLGGIQA